MASWTHTLFVLLPAGSSDALLFAQAPPELAALRDRIARYRHPPATDARHLLGLVRAGRHPAATRWLRGMLGCAGLGGVLGALTNGILTGAFGMFHGLLHLAVPLGLGVGTFLGILSGAMAGTESARDEVRELARQVRAGDVLTIVTAPDRATLQSLVAQCAAAGLAHRLRE